jgi:hypothetical protein
MNAKSQRRRDQNRQEDDLDFSFVARCHRLARRTGSNARTPRLERGRHEHFVFSAAFAWRHGVLAFNRFSRLDKTAHSQIPANLIANLRRYFDNPF